MMDLCRQPHQVEKTTETKLWNDRDGRPTLDGVALSPGLEFWLIEKGRVS